MRKLTYPTDLIDGQWELIAPLIPSAKPGGRPRGVDMRLIMDGVLYAVRSGCAWRLLPKDFGPWSTVYGYYRRWRIDGTWQRIHDALRVQVREKAGREESPSAAIIDSQTVKTTEKGAHVATMPPSISLDESGICS